MIVFKLALSSFSICPNTNDIVGDNHKIMDNFSSVLSLDYRFGGIERLPLIETMGFDRLFRTMVIIRWTKGKTKVSFQT